MKFGDNLRNMRKKHNLSQEELSEKVRVSRQSVSKWETGDAYPEMNNLLELCKIFKCQINDLVNDSIIDIDSLDDEVLEKVVLLQKEKL
ncbi:MAG: helix-turn-helix transcriptional regulator [Bacilli bacterium]|nr:helix-turn-helix transcriptional regulator [Bacilli bacterium]